MIMRLGWTYHDLLRLSKVVERVPVELHLAQWRDRHVLLWNYFCRIKEIEAKTQFVLFVHDLNTELCLRALALGLKPLRAD